MKRLVLLVVPMVGLAARGDDPPPREKEKEAPSALREQYQLSAKKYEFYLDKDKKVPLVLEPKPVFSWANDDDWSGDVFVWMARGRPQVIGCMLSGPGKADRPAYHEFHTLAAGPLGPADMTAKYQWAPRAGLDFRKFDGAPAATPAGRLPQMRAIARDLTVFMEAGGKWELRLLAQPLMRYQPTEGDVIDGALFTWVWTKGTDPELLVAVECHRTKGGMEWRVAPVQFTNREVWVTHGDKELWRIPVHREPSDATYDGLYTTRYAGRIILPPEKKAP